MYHVWDTRYHVPFYLWLIGSVLRHCKVPKYYDQDCSSTLTPDSLLFFKQLSCVVISIGCTKDNACLELWLIWLCATTIPSVPLYSSPWPLFFFNKFSFNLWILFFRFAHYDNQNKKKNFSKLHQTINLPLTILLNKLKSEDPTTLKYP